jgi:hypothetical protein
LVGFGREVYLACDRCCSARELATSLTTSLDSRVSVDRVRDELAPLVDAGLVMTDGRRYLSLARLLGGRPMPAKFLVQFALGLVTEHGDVT